MKNSASGPKYARSAIFVLARCCSALRAMNRGSRAYGSRVIGSWISPMTLRVGWQQNGSMNTVEASGITSMSLSLMFFQPRMLEPSKGMPSANVSSESRETGIVKCCHLPGKSMNLMSTNSTPFDFANSNTSRGVPFMRRS